MDTQNLPIAVLVILLITIIISIKAFKDEALFERFQLSTEGVLIQKMYFKLLYSGFVHSNWAHLICNSIALFYFGSFIELKYGKIVFLLVYLVSVIFSSLFELYHHRFNPYYVSIGASGGTFGLLTVFIIACPTCSISLMLLPIGIPAWIFGIISLIGSYYGMVKRIGNIGHSAHLAGGIFGVFIGIILNYSNVIEYPLEVIALIIVSIAIIAIYVNNDRTVILHDILIFTAKYKDKYYRIKTEFIRNDIDQILEKIEKQGIKSLTLWEKMRLKFFSKRVGSY